MSGINSRFTSSPAPSQRLSRNVSRRMAALAMSLAAVSGMALAAPAQAAWVSTSTKALPLKSSVRSSRLASGAPVHVTVSLKTQNKSGLDSFLQSLHTPGNPAYGKPLTPAQYLTHYAPSVAQAKLVTDYLSAQGFRNITLSANRQLVNADATAAQAETAFNTTLVQFVLGGKTAFTPSSPAMVPASLNGIVQSVLGLSNVPNLTTHTFSMRKGGPANVNAGKASSVGVPPLADLFNAPANGYTAANFQTAYSAAGTPTGAGTVIAVATGGDLLTQVVADLRTFESVNGLPQVPYEIVQSSAPPATLDTSGDDEWDLDSQMSTGMAGNVAKLVFYNGSGIGDINTFNDFAEQDIAKVGNMSFGGCEILDYIDGDIAADDQAYEEAVAQGQTWFASSGDAGAACTLLFNIVTPDSGVVGEVEYPASSPYVVAVGGTSLFTDTNFNYGFEISWDAGGGGTSLFETAPSWQTAVVPTAKLGLRGVPDMAMDSAGPTFGAPELGGVQLVGAGADIIVNGAPAQLLGTSLSSPLAVGSWARIESAHCNALGFAAPYLYALNPTPATLFSTATGFNDVTLGTNGLFIATPGWDYTTGYGSFNITAVNAALPAAPAGCTP